MPCLPPALVMATVMPVAAIGFVAAGTPGPVQPHDPGQALERTCFQTGGPYQDTVNLRSDVAIVYGIDPGLPDRIRTWRERGYGIHVMTGVSWGNYQDYLYGRFDGINHEDEAQTDRQGRKISHGGDVYYMCPGENYGKFLCIGVERALSAGADAIHLEEPEFWVRGGYSDGFKRAWQAHYGEPWQAPHSSPDAQWRASKLKYALYRRALGQVFDFVQAWNREHGRAVRCYVPTHSLLNYAHWRIVSPESSLARLAGCDGYIAQVWTGTARTPNLYRGRLRERTFETAFLEYGAMQNLVRATNRRVWYLNDPVEDDPNHDWADYRTNWESTLVASALQADVWRYEVMPWPERVFGGSYPARHDRSKREPIPPAYATELQTVLHALADLNQPAAAWQAGTPGVGLVVSDSLMFQRGEPAPGDPHLSTVYGLALPLLKRGVPVEPLQLENATLPGALDRYRVLLLTYRGMKPLSPDVHAPLARWTRRGGVLVVCDDDADPYHRVREWWNQDGQAYATPRLHLFERLGLEAETRPGQYRVGRGVVAFASLDPARLAAADDGDARLLSVVRAAATSASIAWKETSSLLLRRGPYVIAAGLDESPAPVSRPLRGEFVNLFDPELRLRREMALEPGTRVFLLDLKRAPRQRGAVLAAACKTWPGASDRRLTRLTVEGVARTMGLLLVRAPRPPRAVTLDGALLTPLRYDPPSRLLWLQFPNEARPREVTLKW